MRKENQRRGSTTPVTRRSLTGTNRPTIVFAGGGHAHLYSLNRTRELVEGSFDVMLVNPSQLLHYSGMAPGVLSGIYHPKEVRMDVRYLVEKGGGRFVKDWVKKIHPKYQELTLLLAAATPAVATRCSERSGR